MKDGAAGVVLAELQPNAAKVLLVSRDGCNCLSWFNHNIISALLPEIRDLNFFLFQTVE